MNKLIVLTIVILVVLAGGYFIYNSSANSLGNPNTAVNSATNNYGGSVSENVKTFVVDSSHFRFYINGVENPDITVNKGDKVRIEFSSSEGFHDFVVDEFSAATSRVNPGQSTSIEFLADKTGTFEYYCSVGQHRANGMKGKFIVN